MNDWDRLAPLTGTATERKHLLQTMRPGTVVHRWLTRLGDHDFDVARYVAWKRHVGAVTQGMTNGIGRQDPMDIPAKHIDGVLGEMAASLILDVSWTPRVNGFRAIADIGFGPTATGVKWSGVPELPITLKDMKHGDRIQVLVTGHGPFFQARGWLDVSEPISEEYWKPASVVRDAAYWIPCRVLHPMAVLYDRITQCRKHQTTES